MGKQLELFALPAPAPAPGWKRVDKTGRKCGAEWLHSSGWCLVHCGHPTANTPWMLFAPDGAQHRAPNGKWWRLLVDAFAYVEAQR